MSRGFFVMALLALVSTAYATTPDGTIDIFMTSSSDPYGLTRPENALQPTGNVVGGVEHYGYDLTDLGAGIPYALQNPGTLIPTPAAPVQIDPTQGEFAYIWVKMNQVNIAAKVNGIQMEWTPNALSAAAYYAVDDSGPGSRTGAIRWHWTGTEAETEFRQNPITLAATSGFSLTLANTAPHPELLRQFYGNEVDEGGLPLPDHADGLWLLGAVAFDSSFRGEVSAQLLQPVVFHGMLETDPLVPTTIVGANVIPEPATLILLAVTLVVGRRR